MSDQNENAYDAFYRYSNSKTFNFMLIEWISLTQGERVTLGQIHADAWEECKPVMKIVSLK
jgi:hypothetical protein